MPVNPNSLKNLKPGNKKGNKAIVTKPFMMQLADYLLSDFEQFKLEIEQLSVKDRIAAKIRLIEMIKPKDFNLNITSESEVTKPTWTIIEVAEPIIELTDYKQPEDEIRLELPELTSED